MSERRQLALLFAAVVALTAVGIVGATLFPEECEELEQAGELRLVFADAADALPVDDEVGAELEALGEDVGIGPWRGAVALPADAEVSRSEFGFFVVTDEDFVVLRPSIGIASAPRGRAGLDAIPTGASLALRAADGTTGVVNGEYELDRCGALPLGAEVLALDRGFGVVDEGPEVALITLSGDEGWRAPAAEAAHITGLAVVLADGERVTLHELNDGDERDEVVVAGGATSWFDAFGDRVLLADAGGVTPLVVTDDALRVDDPITLPFGPGAVDAAVLTPGGVVALGTVDGGRSALATDRSGDTAVLAPPVTPVALHASEDGMVGLLVDVDGSRALLVFGRDVAADG